MFTIKDVDFQSEDYGVEPYLNNWPMLYIMGEDMPSLERCEVISMDDLEEFSDETRETIERMVSWKWKGNC